MISPGLMGHVENPYNWNEFIFHVGCSHDLSSIMDKGLIAGGREKRKEENMFFFTPLNPSEEILMRKHQENPSQYQKSTLSQCLERQTGCGVFIGLIWLTHRI